MELFEILTKYVNIVTWGICLCIGYVFKNLISKFPNKYIPLSMLILGVVINVLTLRKITPEIILSGMISGLSSTGGYELYKNWQKDNFYK
ncbi:MAG: phage holin family protein [Clostridiales bacterium]|nr:phage holin family protein [Clostridiales bacterium]